MARILVIHHENHVSKTIYDHLRAEGHSVACAESIEETISIIDEIALDLVLVDATLDGASGQNLFREIHGKNCIAEGILIVEEPDLRTVIESIRGGIRDYITVPVDRDNLLRSVTRVLQLQQLADLNRRLSTENLRYQYHLEEMVRQKTGSLNAALHQTIRLQDREKSTLAHLLYENITRHLASLRLAWDDLDLPEGVSREQGTALLNRAARTSRNLVLMLDPLQLPQTGLAAALHGAAAAIFAGSTVTPVLDTGPLEDLAPEALDIHLYRVVEELMRCSRECLDGGELRLGIRSSDDRILLTVTHTGDCPAGKTPHTAPEMAALRERLRILKGTLNEESPAEGWGFSLSIPSGKRKAVP